MWRFRLAGRALPIMRSRTVTIPPRIAASRGFTIVEIAIVLVVFGLLLGGILKGQELINAAKIQAIAARQSEFQKAALLFIDHYGAMPGDLRNASTYISGATDGSGDGIVTENEGPMALQHLTASGFLRCGNCTETSTASSMRPSTDNSPINRYGGIMSLWHDTQHYAFVSIAIIRPVRPLVLQTHTGPRIPSDIMKELDRKLDDGVPNRGFVRFNAYDPLGVAQRPSNAECTGRVTGTPLTSSIRNWRSHSRRPPVISNCGGSFIVQ